MKLHFGFESYSYPARFTAESPLPKSKRRKTMTKPQAAYGAGKTTDQVAKELEENYGIVESFYETEEAYIVELLEENYAGQIEEVMAGTEVPKEGITSKETDKLETRFRYGLSRERYHMRGKVPTTAAERGVSHLYAKPYARRGPRPSFIDTSLYQRSFRAWIEED